MKKTAFISILVLLIVNFGFDAYQYFNNKHKIGFIRSDKLISSYKGTIEARTKFQIQIDDWQNSIDTLDNEYKQLVEQFEAIKSKLSGKEKSQYEEAIAVKEEELTNYLNSVQEKSSKAEEDMLRGVYSQINGFIESYSLKNGFTIVLGTTSSGNILYGSDAIDITEDVLKEINEQY